MNEGYAGVRLISRRRAPVAWQQLGEEIVRQVNNKLAL